MSTSGLRFRCRRAMRLHTLEGRVVPTVFVVFNPSDAGAGSLRQAILDANAAAGPDSITFDPTAFALPQTIVLTSGQLTIEESVTVTGPGLALATVSGNKTSRVFAIDPTASGDGVTLSGLTIQDGSADVGAGIFVTGAAVTIVDCVITGNDASSRGGGIYADGYLDPASLTLQSCTVSNNAASSLSAGRGGAVYGYFAALTFGGCTISGNFARLAGGGVYCYYSPAAFTNCSISGNSAASSNGGSGGGVFSYGNAVDQLTLTNCSIIGNSAKDGGGALNCSQVDVVLVNCTISGNTAAFGVGGVYGLDTTMTLSNCSLTGNTGGGLYCTYNAEVTLSNCTVSGNASIASGGGIYCYSYSTARLTNCTVSGNSSRGSGGGIYCGYYSTTTLTNCTVTGNTADSDANGSGTGGGLYSYYYSPTTLLNTIVAGNLVGTASLADDIGGDPLDAACSNSLIGHAATAGGLTHGVNGNIVGVAGSGTIPIATILNTNLASNGGLTKTHALAAGSLAIDAGSDAVLGPPLNLATDQRGAGFARLSGAHVDIGAFEVLPPPPAVSTSEVNGGAVQRSKVTALRITFSAAVGFPAGVAAAFRLDRAGPGPPAGLVNLNAIQSGNTVDITFADGGAIGLDPGGSLADGSYQLTIVAANVTGAGGTLDGNGDGTAGDDYGSPTTGPGRIHRLFGDVDGDGDNDAADFGALRLAAASGAIALFDFDGDGSLDFGEYRTRFGSTV